jgi:hypothetical protein
MNKTNKTNKTNDNICFFFKEKVNDKKEANDSEIQKMMEEFTKNELMEDFEQDYEQDYEQDFEKDYNRDFLSDDVIDDDEKINNLRYFFKKDVYNNDELYYDQEYTVKDLFKICKYYGIDKNIKASKCKKNDIINTIIFFEVLPENSDIVKRRHRMWAYITELINDPKLKQYIIWS